MFGDQDVPSGGGGTTVYGTQSKCRLGGVFAGRVRSTMHGNVGRAAMHSSLGRLVSSMLTACTEPQRGKSSPCMSPWMCRIFGEACDAGPWLATGM